MIATLTCIMCGKPMRECCDLFHEAVNEDGEIVVVCNECVIEHNIEFEDDDETE